MPKSTIQTKADPEEKLRATETFMAIGRAQEVLSDEEKRAAFDEELFLGAGTPVAGTVEVLMAVVLEATVFLSS